MAEESIVLKSAKSELSTDQRLMFDNEYEKKKKSKLTAYLLWFFLGFFGVHKFYLKKVGMGILYIFTAGLGGIGWLIDVFIMSSQINKANEAVAKDTVLEVKMLTKSQKSEQNVA
jgi:TM2 domain-containing membrane protein YozV